MADFNLQAFMSHYENYARSYLFYFNIISDGGSGIDKNVTYLVSSTELPAGNVDEGTVNWQGNIRKIATTTQFGDLSVTFNLDDKAATNARNQFLKWQQKIHDPATNKHGIPSNGQGYYGELNLQHLDGQGNVMTEYKIFGAFPKSVGAVSLDYGSKNIATFQVSFTYQYHTVVGVNG